MLSRFRARYQYQHDTSKPHTWEEPLASLHSVVAHAEVSAGVNHRFLIQKAHIVDHLFAQTKDVVALCNYRGHVAGMESDKNTERPPVTIKIHPTYTKRSKV